MNVVFFVGNIVRDIELKYLPSGSAVAKSAIAVTKRYSVNGEKREDTMFIDLTFWARSAEIAAQYLHKGSKIAVNGELVLETWTDQQGQKRSKHSVTVETMEMLTPKAQDQGAPAQQAQPQYQAPQAQYQAPAQQAQPQYQAPQAQYQAPAQQAQPQYQAPQAQYQAPAQQAQPQYQAPQAQYQAPAQQPQRMPQQPPVIDINEDDIPF